MSRLVDGHDKFLRVEYAMSVSIMSVEASLQHWGDRGDTSYPDMTHVTFERFTKAIVTLKFVPKSIKRSTSKSPCAPHLNSGAILH